MQIYDIDACKVFGGTAFAPLLHTSNIRMQGGVESNYLFIRSIGTHPPETVSTTMKTDDTFYFGLIR